MYDHKRECVMRKYKRDKRSPVPKSENVSRIMSHIKGKSSAPELIVRKNLYCLGIRGYRINYKKLPGKPDLAFISKKLVIFIHGCFWHGCIDCGRRIPKHNSEYWSNKINKNIERDQRHKVKLEKMGFQVIEVWEHEIKKDLQALILKLVIELTKEEII